MTAMSFPEQSAKYLNHDNTQRKMQGEMFAEPAVQSYDAATPSSHGDEQLLHPTMSDWLSQQNQISFPAQSLEADDENSEEESHYDIHDWGGCRHILDQKGEELRFAFFQAQLQARSLHMEARSRSDLLSSSQSSQQEQQLSAFTELCPDSQSQELSNSGECTVAEFDRGMSDVCHRRDLRRVRLQPSISQLTADDISWKPLTSPRASECLPSLTEAVDSGRVQKQSTQPNQSFRREDTFNVLYDALQSLDNVSLISIHGDFFDSPQKGMFKASGSNGSRETVVVPNPVPACEGDVKVTVYANGYASISAGSWAVMDPSAIGKVWKDAKQTLRAKLVKGGHQSELADCLILENHPKLVVKQVRASSFVGSMELADIICCLHKHGFVAHKRDPTSKTRQKGTLVVKNQDNRVECKGCLWNSKPGQHRLDLTVAAQNHQSLTLKSVLFLRKVQEAVNTAFIATQDEDM